MRFTLLTHSLILLLLLVNTEIKPTTNGKLKVRKLKSYRNITTSHGREAFVGSLFLLDSALHATNPPNPELEHHKMEFVRFYQVEK